MTDSCVNLRTEAGFKLHNRLHTTHPVFAPAAPLTSILLWAQPTPSDPAASSLFLPR
jgi:hypothetical protein